MTRRENTSSPDQVEIDIRFEDSSTSTNIPSVTQHNQLTKKEEKTLVQEHEDQEQQQQESGTELTRTSTVQTVHKKMTDLLGNPFFSGVLLILAGSAIAFQAGCNATLNKYGGRAFSSVISFSVGVGCCLIFFAFDVTVAGTPVPNNYVRSEYILSMRFTEVILFIFVIFGSCSMVRLDWWYFRCLLRYH
jgi:hypothetical protein